MKKLGLLFVVMISLFVLPISVLADKNNSKNEDIESNEKIDDEESDKKKSKVKVYFFHGDGCPHCADAEEFFDSLEDEYGDLFDVVAYETWYNEENSALLEEIGETRDETITGVPYILIGNKSWAGYASDYDDEIIDAIKDEYSTPDKDRYDIMDLIDIANGDDEKENKASVSSDVITLILIIIVVAGIVGGVVVARKKAN